MAICSAGLAVGFIAGLALRSRWAMLLAPLAHVTVFELARAGHGETDRRLYLDVVSYAAQTGDQALAATMRALGPPPYDQISANAMEQMRFA